MSPAAGDRVILRGEQWTVDATTAFADVALVTLTSAEPGARPRRRQVLVPFDRPAVIHPRARLRAVAPRHWTRLFRTALSGERVHGRLCAARRADITLLPFQLEPALALVQGRASRFLLADEVGLGKTIQAGLMLAELRHRSMGDRALIITPPGLRQQWADELRDRFGIPSLVVDAPALARLSASLPYDVNPWDVEQVVITSIDFVKRPEVHQALAAQLWDLVIVDEAHQAGTSSQRHQAVEAVAVRARRLVLLTATPHAGDEEAFRALCALGRLGPDDGLLLFRRTRERAGLPRRRRAHLLAVRQTSDALDLHRQLEQYVHRLWRIAHDAGRADARLVAMVLTKRAFSSAHSLLRSLERRIAGLDAAAEPPPQPLLPFDGDTDDSDEPSMPLEPAFDRAADERALLVKLADAARRAARDDRKLSALRRLVRRVREPIIVFTEYRDTLEAIRGAIGGLRRTTALHGGQTPQERRDSIGAFTAGAADVLLATDAGSEGLNLQRSCRLVVNLELPWNPIRLEQRIGRVDRIGQTHTVHAINLLAEGTSEAGVLARLLNRIDRIRASEIEIAACVIGREEPAPRPRVEPGSTAPGDLRDAAIREGHRLAAARSLGRELDAAALAGLVPATAVQARRRESLAFHQHGIVFLRVRLVSRAGGLVEDTLVPAATACRIGRHPSRRQVKAAAEALVAKLRPSLVAAASRHALARAKALGRLSANATARAAERERHIVRHALDGAPSLVQAGLFESRALNLAAGRRRQLQALSGEIDRHLQRLEDDACISLQGEPSIAFVLFVC